MAETLDELTYDYEEDGLLVRKQLDRVVLSQGGWPTMMFLFQELDRNSGTFRAPKMAIVRFKKSRGTYRKQSSFNISNETQARQISAVFESWYPKIAGATASGGADEGDSEEVEVDDGDAGPDETAGRDRDS
jgi:hypothetical protein